MQPRLTIGLPVFNGEQYLEESVDSILAQSFRDFELILADNASTDRTREICEAYAAKDSRVRYIRQSQNLGAAGNYNCVVREARGELFKWAAHDDRLAPDLVRRSIAILDANPDVVLCHPRTVMIDAEGSRTSDFIDDLNLMQEKPHQRVGHLVTHVRLCNSVFGVMRLDVLLRTRLIDSFHSADFVLLLELAILGKFYEMEEHLYYRRDHPDRILRKTRDRSLVLAWFDPNASGKARFPKVRIFREQHRSIGSLGLPLKESLLCRLQTGRWVLKRWRVTLGRWRRKVAGRPVPQH